MLEAQMFTGAQVAAAKGNFEEFLKLGALIEEQLPKSASALQRLGALYGAYGFVSRARACYQAASGMKPGDFGVIANVANLLREIGEHNEANRLYRILLERLSDHPVVRRNFLTGLEYDPDVTDSRRVREARAWGAWAVLRAGGELPRPAQRPLNERPLRVGYVSADFCQHTVGLFVKDVIKAHDPAMAQAFAYSSGQVDDWVTKQLRASCTLRDVAALDDVSLSNLIRSDQIDVLVDLSGHTAGSRLTMFALRPASVMVSWLGYFATTGLPYMDAVLLDEWHAGPDASSQMLEPIVRLRHGRFCYQPVPWAPAVAEPPAMRNGYVTFGSFNNTAKLNSGVYDLWSRVLLALPTSRLVLKWRTFNDESFRGDVRRAFAKRGVAEERIELRGPSFHSNMLKEYGDIDIALDPFPFTGGLTSCEALWMGIPVVTWRQSRIVSRQTHAFLNQIGRPEWSASNADDYVRIATGLAEDTGGLREVRMGMRDRMRASPLMDVAGFTRELESTLLQIYEDRRLEEARSIPT